MSLILRLVNGSCDNSFDLFARSINLKMPKIYIDIADNKSPLVNPFKSFDHREFLCGWGSAFINITMTYPLYKTIFRQMLHGVKIGTAFKQLRTEGITFLYRGMFPPLAQKTLSLSLMFGVYDGIKVIIFNLRQSVAYLVYLLASRNRILSNESIFRQVFSGNGCRNV